MKRKKAVRSSTPEDQAFDKKIGERVRASRHLLGLSQTDLAQKIGVTFQQVQKYEHGTNRISGSRMNRIAEVLERPVSYFFGEDTGKKFAEAGLSPEAVKLAKRYDAAPEKAKEMIRRSVSAFSGAHA